MVYLEYLGNANKRMKRNGGLVKRDEAEPGQQKRIYYQNFNDLYVDYKKNNNISGYLPTKQKLIIKKNLSGKRIMEYITTRE